MKKENLLGQVQIRGSCNGPICRVMMNLSFDDEAVNIFFNEAAKWEGNFGAFKRSEDGNYAVVLTDPAGSVPVYYRWAEGKWAVAWKSAELASTENDFFSVDPVSAGDFILNETVCYPMSLFRGVTAAAPGSVTILTPTGASIKKYYEPREESGDGINYLAEELRESLISAIQDNVAGNKKVDVLFSGGEDARAVVSLLARDHDIRLWCFSDSENRETKLARRAAVALGYKIDVMIRPEGFYKKEVEERVRAVGGGFDVRHTHVFGELADAVREADVLLGGNGADALLKTTRMANVSRRFGGVGPERIAGSFEGPVGVAGRERYALLRRDVGEEVERRRSEHHERLRRIRPKTAGTWHTLWPLGTQRNTYAHYLACLLVGPKVVEPFMDSRVFKVAARVPEQYRVDRKIVHAALAREMGAAGWVPTSSGRIPRVRGWSGRLIELGIYGGWTVARHVKRRKAKVMGQRVYLENPWSPEHYAFKADPDEILGKQRADRMREFMMDAVLQPTGRTYEETAEKMSLEERFRAIQVGIFL